jgi:transposase
MKGRTIKIPRQEYTAEFKELAVKRVNEGLTAGAAAKELGLVEQTLRNWVKATAAGTLHGAETKRVTPEQRELARLRAENVRLQRENEILKKRRRTSQGTRCNVRLDRRTTQRLCAG